MGLCYDGSRDRSKHNINRQPAPTRREINNNTQDIREETISKKEKNIKEKEELLNKREENLIYRESNINEREQNINNRENEIQQINKSTYSKQYIINQTENKVNYPEFEENNHDKISNNNLYDKPYMGEYKIIQKKKQEEIEKSKEFYDMVLDFSNFEQLKQDGWKILWPEDKTQDKGQNKYNRCKENKNVVVGILGNKNRGKSFLLGRIIGKHNFINKSGFLITTQGISANFPLLDDNTNIITLDTAGKDNPLLDSSNFVKISDSNSNIKDKSKNENIKNIARDQRVSEIVLSDFIIKESDVLITVLEQLSFAEQDMLKNLINQLKSQKMEANSIREKKLLVIHNLMNFTDIKTIDNFIQNTLLKSLTFDLRKGKQAMSNFKEDDSRKGKKSMSNIKEGNINDRDKFVYVQKTENLDKLRIFHIIVGNDFIPEVRENYNEPAIRFIRKAIKIGSARKIDLIEDFKNFIIQNSQKYLNGSGFPNKSLEIKKQGNIPEAIILNKKYENNINLKSFFTDSKGINNFLSTIEPKYSTKIYKEKSGEKYFIKVIFEIFGKIEGDIKSTINVVSNQHVITIEGKITDNKNINKEIVQGNLKYSEFYFQIIIDKYISLNENKTQYSIAKIYNEQKENLKDEKLGIYIIKYPIKFIKMT